MRSATQRHTERIFKHQAQNRSSRGRTMKSDNIPEQINHSEKDQPVSRRVFFETILILIITFIAQFLWKDFRLVIAFVPTAYFLLEKYARRRSWKEIGFNFRAIPKDLKANLHFIILVSVVVQFLVVWGAKEWFPSFLDHVIGRFPLTISAAAGTLPLLMLGAFWEELNYRALFQERLSWTIRAPAAIVLVSVLFGIGHWAEGDPIILMIDILLVIVDSIFYGIIFERSKNLFISWTTHFLANLLAIVFFLWL